MSLENDYSCLLGASSETSDVNMFWTTTGDALVQLLLTLQQLAGTYT
jgi:hypothetical protein